MKAARINHEEMNAQRILPYWNLFYNDFYDSPSSVISNVHIFLNMCMNFQVCEKNSNNYTDATMLLSFMSKHRFIYLTITIVNNISFGKDINAFSVHEEKRSRYFDLQAHADHVSD